MLYNRLRADILMRELPADDIQAFAQEAVPHVADMHLRALQDEVEATVAGYQRVCARAATGGCELLFAASTCDEGVELLHSASLLVQLTPRTELPMINSSRGTRSVWSRLLGRWPCCCPSAPTLLNLHMPSMQSLGLTSHGCLLRLVCCLSGAHMLSVWEHL